MSTKKRLQYRKGNVDDSRVLTVAGFADLTNVASVAAEVTQGAVTTALGAGSVSDAATSEITIEFGGAAGWLATVATVGWARGKYTLTFGDGSEIQVPDDDAGDLFEVTDS